MRYCSNKQSPLPPTCRIDKPHSANLDCHNISPLTGPGFNSVSPKVNIFVLETQFFSCCLLAELQRAKRASEAPWVRKIGNPSSRENLVKGSLKCLLMPLLGKNQFAITLPMCASTGPNLDNSHRELIWISS